MPAALCTRVVSSFGIALLLTLSSAAATADDCLVTGCSGQLCAEQHTLGDCEWRPEYACYRQALCERQADGACGWTETPQFLACLSADSRSENCFDGLDNDGDADFDCLDSECAAEPECYAAVEIGSVTGAPGQRVTFEVRLRGTSVSGVENYIVLDPRVPLGLRTTGSGVRPDCRLPPHYLHPEQHFAFRPTGCTPLVDCLWVQALVFGIYRVDPLIDGEVLYTCNVDIPADAAAGRYPLACIEPIASSPHGVRLIASCREGEVVVVPGLPTATGTLPTATPTPTPIPILPPTAPADPTNTAAPCQSCPVLDIRATSGNPGDQVVIEVRLHTGERAIAGIQNDITFHPGTPLEITDANRPDCTSNRDVGKQTAVAFRDHGNPCFGGYRPDGERCNEVRAIVLSLTDSNSIPDGSLLYTCNVRIADNAVAGEYPLLLSNMLASDPDGNPLALGGEDGVIVVHSSSNAAAAGGASAIEVANEGGGGCSVDPSPGTVTTLLLVVPILILRRRGLPGHHAR